ncbi:MAG: UPF0236 family protein, partial [Acetobacteraceae bacterium]|nr:UPF0236 family protein [Acetobacteraceae bacterium]
MALPKKKVSRSRRAGGEAKKEIFVLADGLSVALQRSQKRRTELKLAVVHTGARQTSPGRCELADKSLVGGLYDGPELWEDVGDVIERKYGWENVSAVTLNGDGASWIKEGVEYLGGCRYQLDRFHLARRMKEALGGDPAGYREVWDALMLHDPVGVSRALAMAEGRVDSKRKVLVRGLRGYIFDNWDGLWGLKREEGLQ